MIAFQNNEYSGLQHRLTEHVPGEECPLVFKLHGSENLLHRAAKQGSYEVVYELLKSGYQVRLNFLYPLQPANN